MNLISTNSATTLSVKLTVNNPPLAKVVYNPSFLILVALIIFIVIIAILLLKNKPKTPRPTSSGSKTV